MLSAIPVGKRRFHLFLSHAHVDKDRADLLYAWLSNVAAIPVWYDAVNMPPGATIAEQLPEAISNSRAMLLLLSKESVERGWVQQEYHAAINHQTLHRAFRIIPVRLDDVNPPGFLQNYSYVDLPVSGLNIATAAGILRGLYQPATAFDPKGGRSVYVSRGWYRDDSPLAEQICSALEDTGLQLVGDSQDQPSWVEKRVVGLIEGCGAYTAVLPYRPHAPNRTSKYILREWELAASHDLPCLVVADPRIDIDKAGLRLPGLVDLATLNGRAESTALNAAAASLSDDWRSPEHNPYAFYIADFDVDNFQIRQVVKEIFESVTGIPCVLGEYVEGEVVQREILNTIAGSAVVLADISAGKPNVYIEIGAARASNVPLFLLRQGPPGRPAFMLRDLQVWDYQETPDLLGRVLRIAYPYRRSLLTPHHL